MQNVGIENGEKFKFRYLRDNDLPTLEALDLYDKTAANMRKILGRSLQERNNRYGAVG